MKKKHKELSTETKHQIQTEVVDLCHSIIKFEFIVLESNLVFLMV